MYERTWSGPPTLTISAIRTSLLGRISFSAALAMAILLVVVGMAVVLRVLALDRVGFNSDEAVYSGQAAALIGDETMSQFFSLFRAHPLLLQTLLGGLFATVGISDLAARLFVALAFGVGTVVLTYLLAYRLYGQRVAIAAAAIMAVLPYHVLVSRQVLVDPALAFFVLLTLWIVARGADDASGRWIIWACPAAGAAFLTKETGILLLPVVGAFLLVTGRWRQVWFRPLMLGLALFTAVIAPYQLSRMLFAPESSLSYLLWQISRPPNHEAAYFLQVLVEFGGLAFIGLATLGLIRMAARLHPGDVLLLLWVAVFFGFHQFWPTKLFSYLIVVIPLMCIAAAVGLDAGARTIATAFRWFRWRREMVAGAAVAVVLVGFWAHMGTSSLAMIRTGPEGVAGPLRFDIEVQDFAGGREFAYWAKENTPPNGRFLTIGPSMGNILRFYGHRDSLALSVSPNPRRRNPAYVPVPNNNPDLLMRQNGIHYIVWDFYSADRSAFYSARLMRYVRKYGGQVVYAVYQLPDGRLAFGTDPPTAAEVRIVVYDVHGGDPLRGSLAFDAQ